MSFTDLGALGYAVGFAAMVVAFVRLVHSLWRHPDYGPTYVARSLLALVAHLASAVIAVLLVFSILRGPQPPHIALLATLFVLTWIGIGTLWLVRLAPRTREPPPWLMRPWGTLDIMLLAVLAASLALLLWLAR